MNEEIQICKKCKREVFKDEKPCFGCLIESARKLMKDTAENIKKFKDLT